jgi:hypothetical protein
MRQGQSDEGLVGCWGQQASRWAWNIRAEQCFLLFPLPNKSRESRFNEASQRSVPACLRGVLMKPGWALYALMGSPSSFILHSRAQHGAAQHEGANNRVCAVLAKQATPPVF